MLRPLSTRGLLQLVCTLLGPMARAWKFLGRPGTAQNNNIHQPFTRSRQYAQRAPSQKQLFDYYQLTDHVDHLISCPSIHYNGVKSKFVIFSNVSLSYSMKKSRFVDESFRGQMNFMQHNTHCATVSVTVATALRDSRLGEAVREIAWKPKSTRTEPLGKFRAPQLTKRKH